MAGQAAGDAPGQSGEVIGIDWGVKETAATTCDAHDLPHAEHGKTAAVKPARHQRMVDRRRTPKNRPDTAGYKKARRAAAKVSKKIARRRQDTGLVHPAHTTMDRAHCGAGAKHRLPLSERTYTRTACVRRPAGRRGTRARLPA